MSGRGGVGADSALDWHPPRTVWGAGGMMHLFCFGFGYCAQALARRVSARTISLAGSRAAVGASDPAPLGARLAEFKGDAGSAQVLRCCRERRCTH